MSEKATVFLLDFMLILFCVVCLLIASCLEARADDWKESDYQKAWCAGKGLIEYPIEDSRYPSRVDCLTDTHAIEFDYINKWPEAISQAKYYAKMTDRKPGVVFIIKDHTNKYNYTYIQRLLNTLTEYESNIQIWFMFHPH